MRQVCLLLTLFVASATAANACQTSLKVNIPSSDPNDLASAEFFKNEVEDRTGGATCVQLFPSSTLYRPHESVDALLNGDLDISIVTANRLDRFGGSLDVFLAPFLFQDAEMLHDFMMDDTSSKITEPITDNGLVPLTFWSAEPAQIYSNLPIEDAGDLAGQAFRTMSNSGIDVLSDRIGFSSSKEDWADFSRSINGGNFPVFETTVYPDQINGPSNSKFAMTSTNHSYDASFLLINSDTLDSLDDATREIILEAGILSGKNRKKRGCEKRLSSIENAEADGLFLSSLTDEAYLVFQRVAATSWSQFAEEDILDSVVEFCPQCAGTAPRPKPKCEK